MGKLHERIDGRLAEFLLAQPVFFVATAPRDRDGHLNISPKGVRGSFAIIDPLTVAYVDYTGSGIETAAHLRDDGRIAMMFCASSGPPNIVRLHGRGTYVPADSPRGRRLLGHFPNVPELGIRGVVHVEVTRISDSCGFAVPLMEYVGERSLLAEWSERKGPDGLTAYWRDRNATSIDGLPGLPG